MCKLGIAVEGPNALQYITEVKLKGVTCDGQVLTLELRAARQFFIDDVIQLFWRAIREPKFVSYLPISISKRKDNKACKLHTPGIANKSATADEDGPLILAQRAISQSHSERKGAQIEAPNAS